MSPETVTILMYRGVSWISAAIRWQTRSEYSHAAIAIGDTLYEAREFKGTLRRPVTVQDLHEADRYYLTVPLGADEIRTLRAFLDAQVGKPYDYRMVARFITRQQETRKSRGKWFCSELVFAAFLECGVAILARTDPWEVSPGLLTRSPLLTTRTIDPYENQAV